MGQGSPLLGQSLVIHDHQGIAADSRGISLELKLPFKCNVVPYFNADKMVQQVLAIPG